MIRRGLIITIAGVLLVGAPAAAVEDVTITSTSGGFQPVGTAAQLGESVRWSNQDNVTHTTTGRSPLSLWDRTIPDGAIRSRTFTQAGAFPYFCRIHPSMDGRVRVGMSASGGQARVGDRFVLRVATNSAPSGFRYRIQRRRAGGAWSVWKVVTSRTTGWTPGPGAVGDWQFRTRTERISNGASSRYSPARRVEIVPA